jgi:hypothetical protein
MSSTFHTRSAAAYEQFMGRWSRQLSGRFVEFAGIADEDGWMRGSSPRMTN